MTYRSLRWLLLSCLFILYAVPARGQPAGLLLGLRYAEPEADPLPYHGGEAEAHFRSVYQTLLIVRHGKEITFAGQAPGLLIPRDTLFWRVNTKRSVYNRWIEDFVWTAPEGHPPQLSGIPAYNGEYCEGHRIQTIHYAGPDYLALEQRSAGYCEDAAHPWHFNTLAVVPIDSTTHLGLPVSEVLGPEGGAAFHAASAARMAHMEEDERALFMQEPDEANWGLVRQEGRWHVRGRLDPSEVSQTRFADFTMEATPQPALIQHDDLRPSWKDVLAAAPDATDAFSSPEGDLVVILHPDRLTVHALVEDVIQPASLLLQLQAQSTAVMAHWTAGRHTERWTARFRQIASPVTVGSRLPAEH